jgi:hypothetical protein
MERAKELLKMVIKPDNFIEVVDIPKSAQGLNNIVKASKDKALAA